MKPSAIIPVLIFFCALCGANQLQAQEKPKWKGNPLMIVKIVKMDRELRIGATDSLLSAIDPSLVTSVDVLKGKSAVDAYGPIAKDGAVIIVLKEGSLWKLPEKYRAKFGKG